MARKKRSIPPPPVDPFANQLEKRPQKKHKTRGASLLKDVVKSMACGTRLPVHINPNGVPYGTNSAKLSSYIGTVVKKWVPITVDNWKLVSAEEKNTIWEEVSGSFDIPIGTKHFVLQKANDLWRAFKKDLGKHIEDEETGELHTEPPAMYDSYITQDQWTDFIKTRQSDEFKNKSAKYKNLSRNNKQSYRGSRKGYAGLEAEYKEDLQMDPSSKVARSIIWLKARMDKNGEYSETAKPIVDKLHILMQQEASGELVTSGQKDVLALALGKSEHPGRVRGVGQTVSISKYWPRGSEGGSSSNVNENAQAEISELKDQLKVMESKFGGQIQELQEVIKNLVEKQPSKEGYPIKKVPLFSTPSPQLHFPQSGKASCSTLKDVPVTSKKMDWQPCKLFWPDTTQIVAHGKLYLSSSSSQVLHNCPLKSGYVKVEVITLIKGDVVVPSPTEEVHTLKEAIGQFISWPEQLVIPVEDHEPSNKDSRTINARGKTLTYESVIGPGEAESEPSSLEEYQWILDDFNGTTVKKVKVNAEIFHYDHPGIEIGRGEIQRWIDRSKIGNTHMILYIRFLFDNHCKGVNDKIRFLCPSIISSSTQSIAKKASYIAKCMEGNITDKIFVAPYHFRCRWVLIIMNPLLCAAYWIDSQRQNVDKDAELLVKMAYRIRYANLGKKTSRNEPLWHMIKCPQHKNISESGYYVSRFIRDLVFHTKQSSVIPINWYGDKITYSNTDLDEIRRDWFDYFLSLV